MSYPNDLNTKADIDAAYAAFVRHGPCKLCADLQDLCPLCQAEIGRIFAADLALGGFVPLDEIQSLPPYAERN